MLINVKDIASKSSKLFKFTKLEKLFLYISIPFLLTFIIVIPPLQGWDEAAHFLRAYQISDGDFIANKYSGGHYGYEFPVNIVIMHDKALADLISSTQSGLVEKVRVDEYGAFLRDNRASTNRIQKYLEASSVYSPLSYLPQSIGILVAKIFNLPILIYIYFGRLLNALLFVIIVYYAIKIAPRGKWAILAIALLPTTMTAAASLSPDAMINSLALLIVALFIRIIISGTVIPIKSLLLIIISLVLISLMKQVYFLFAFLFLFVPPRLFGNIKQYIIFNFIVISLSLAVMSSWYLLTDDIAKNISISNRPGININVFGQINYVLSEPFTSARTLIWHVVSTSSGYYWQLVGHLTWKGVMIPQVIILLSYIGLIVSFFNSMPQNSVKLNSVRERRLAVYGPIAIAVAIFLAIIFVLYVSFNPVGSNTIAGVQGRYFIPLLPLILPLAVMTSRSKLFVALNKSKTKKFMVFVFLSQNIVALCVVFGTNYIDGFNIW